ncbi:hypothetical protein EMCRGX_G000683 [Ephydatia muelleri]
MMCPTCLRSITIPEGAQNLHPGLGMEVTGYMSKIGSSDEKSCDVCIDGGKGPAVVFCCTCDQFLCTLCHEHHQRSKILHNHQIVGPHQMSQRLLPSTMTPIKHLCSHPHHDNEELKFYCDTCLCLVCRVCTLILHKDHKIAEVEKSTENATLLINQAFERLLQVIEERKKILFSEMEAISLSKTAALTLQKKELMKMQDEIGRYSEMISHILQTYSDHEMVALGDLQITEIKTTLNKFGRVSFTPSQTSEIHVTIKIISLIQDLSNIGHVMGSIPSPPQSTWSSESIAMKNKGYSVKVETKSSKGERYPYGGLQVKAELRPKSSKGVVVPGVVEDHGDGSYTITLTPQTAGPHQLLITMEGEHVQGSPHDLDVRHKKSNYRTLCDPQQVISYIGGPSGIAIHDSGDIYVTCRGDGDCSIRVFDQAGQQKGAIGIDGSGDGQFSHAHFMTIKGDVMYVADTYNHRIQKLTTGGQFLQKFGQKGSSQGQFSRPLSVIVDQQDRMIVADNDNNRVVMMDQNGCWLLTINGNVTGTQSFKDPWGLALDPQGNIYVADRGSNTIKVFTPMGTYVRSFGKLDSPSGISIDEEGKQDSHCWKSQ